MEATNKQAQRNEILKIVSTLYPNFSETSLAALIAATDNIGGCSFIALRNYTSDKSSNTELQDHTVNIGASYAGMLTRDEDKLAAFDINTLDVDKINWKKYNLKGVSQEDFKAQVKAAAPQALAEMQAPKQKKDTSHMVWLNKCLFFNTTTQRLTIFGMKIKGTVTVEGEHKPVASAPKTVAKELIGKQANLSASKLRAYCLDNLLSHISIKGDTIEINCDYAISE